MLYYLFQYLENEFHFPGATLFQFITFRAGLSALSGLFIAIVFGKKFIKYLKKKQIGENIRKLGLEGENEKSGVPTMGGLLIIFATLVPVILLTKLHNVYIIILIITTIWMGLIGFLDDYIKVFKNDKKGLRGKFKVLGQVGLGLIVVLIIYNRSDITVGTKDSNIAAEETASNGFNNPFTYEYNSFKTTIPFVKNNELDYGEISEYFGFEKSGIFSWIIYCFVAILIITAVSNSTNLTDGLDGLAAGTSIVVTMSLGLLAWISGNIIFSDYLNVIYIPNSAEMVIFISAFVGALIGFMWFNTFPAQIFMGDTGSITIGGIIAVLALLVRKELMLPIICGVFFVESLSVIMQVSYFKFTKRKFGVGKRIFLMSPIHHHYQKKGYHESKIVNRMIIVNVLLAIIAVITLKIR